MTELSPQRERNREGSDRKEVRAHIHWKVAQPHLLILLLLTLFWILVGSDPDWSVFRQFLEKAIFAMVVVLLVEGPLHSHFEKEVREHVRDALEEITRHVRCSEQKLTRKLNSVAEELKESTLEKLLRKDVTAEAYRAIKMSPLIGQLVADSRFFIGVSKSQNGFLFKIRERHKVKNLGERGEFFEITLADGELFAYDNNVEIATNTLGPDRIPIPAGAAKVVRIDRNVETRGLLLLTTRAVTSEIQINLSFPCELGVVVGPRRPGERSDVFREEHGGGCHETHTINGPFLPLHAITVDVFEPHQIQTTYEPALIDATFLDSVTLEND